MTELFLKHGNKVFGVEPNREMRAAGESLLATYPSFISVNATAEATTLVDRSIDFIVVGQAFHWFDHNKTKLEFKRVLKSDGWVVLVWNGFDLENSALVRGYHELLVKYGTDYQDVSREIESCDVEKFFAPRKHSEARFPYQQVFDLEGFKGRLLSASYAPQPGDARYEEMIAELREVFAANQRNGKVDFNYDTRVYYGQL